MLRRRLAAALATAALALGLAVAPAVAAGATAPGQPRADLEVDQVDLINQARAAEGLDELVMHQMLTRLARQHSRVMAQDSSSAGARSLCGDGRTLRHRSPLDTGFTQNWSSIRENVGCDSHTSSGDHVHGLFMGSSGHRANILAADVTMVGVGTYLDSAGVLWTTQIFMRENVTRAGRYASATVLPRTDVLREGATASSATFGDDAASLVVVGRSDTFPDLLGGAALAGGNGPVLFTDPPHAAEGDPVLNPRTMDELDRVLPAGGDVFLVGGPAAVSAATEQELRAKGYRVTRLAGEHRHATARAIAEAVVAREGSPGTVLVANGRNWPDAITGGNAAGVLGLPVVLVERDSVPADTAAFLAAHPSARRVVLGGPAVVSDAVVAELGAERVAGDTRVGTSVAIAQRFFPTVDGDLVVGYGWGDTQWGLALAWTGRSIAAGAPQVLARADIAAKDPDLAAWLRANAGSIDDVVFTSAVPASVRAEVRSLLGR